MKNDDRKLLKFLQKLPPQAAYYIKSGKPPRFFAFFTISGARAYLERDLQNRGNIYEIATGQQVA